MGTHKNHLSPGSPDISLLDGPQSSWFAARHQSAGLDTARCTRKISQTLLKHVKTSKIEQIQQKRSKERAENGWETTWDHEWHATNIFDILWRSLPMKSPFFGSISLNDGPTVAFSPRRWKAESGKIQAWNSAGLATRGRPAGSGIIVGHQQKPTGR